MPPCPTDSPRSSAPSGTAATASARRRSRRSRRRTAGRTSPSGAAGRAARHGAPRTSRIQYRTHGSARSSTIRSYPSPTPLHLDDADDRVRCSTCARSPTWSATAFGAWGRGEAATTQRVRAAAERRDGERDGRRRAAVLRRQGVRHHTTGVFTFVIVLFDVEGRLLCTLDGDELTRAAHAGDVARSPIRALAAPAPVDRGAHRRRPPGLDPPRDARPRSCPALERGRASHDRVADAASRARRSCRSRLASRRSRPSTATDAVDGADVVVTVTPQHRAVVRGRRRSATAP